MSSYIFSPLILNLEEFEIVWGLENKCRLGVLHLLSFN